MIIVTMSRSQAITVKSLGPTNTKPARLRVTTTGGAFSTTFSRHEFGDEPQPEALAKFLKTLPKAWLLFNWRGAFIDADTCVFIATSPSTEG